MSDESELQALCKNILETSDEKRFLAQAVDFLEACRRYEKVRGELPLIFRTMEAKIFARQTGIMPPVLLETAEYYDVRHATRRGVPTPVAQHIANNFRETRKKSKGFFGW